MSSVQVFCRISFNWDLSEVFVTIRLALWLWQGKPKKFHFHHIISKVLSTWLITIYVDFHHLVEVLFVKFSFFSLFHTVLFWKEVITHSPYFRSMELCSISLMEQYLHTVYHLEFFCTWEYSFPPIYFVYHLFISVGSSGHLFYTFGYNPVLCYLFCWSNCPSFGHWQLLQSAPVP